MEQSFRPSKQFIVRGVFAIGALAIILVIQTDWFRGLLNKEPLPSVAPEATVNDLLTKDSNGNGIADWEEKLWGLDPAVLYTNGVPNKTVIEQKKLALGATGGSQAPENETDALARELMTIATALGQEGQSDTVLAAIATKMADSVQVGIASNHYGLKDLRTIPTTTASLQKYYTTFVSLSSKYDNNMPEIDLVVSALESGDLSQVAVLAETQKTYESYARALIVMEVPVGIQNEHLQITNSMYAIGLSLGYLSKVSDNAVHALAGIALYRVNDQRLVASADNIISYLVRYGILNP